MPTQELRQLPISEFQKQFFLEWALNPLESTYTVSFVNRIVGNLDPVLLKRACEVFIERNEVMHAQYSADGRYCHYGDFTIDDFFEESELDSNQSIETRIKEILAAPFNITSGVLSKFYLIKSHSDRETEYHFIFVAQHILIDIVAIRRVRIDISDVYNTLLSGGTVSIHPDKTFTNAVEWEKSVLTDEYKTAAQQYWTNFIGDLSLKTNLPTLPHSETDIQDKTAEFIHFELNSEHSLKLGSLAKEKQTTLFTIFSAIWGFVLSKYSNQNTILLSYPFNARISEFETVVGCFVNNSLLKIEFGSGRYLEDIIKSVGVQRKEGRKHRGYSYTNIILDQRKIRNEGAELFCNVVLGQTELNTLRLDLSGVQVFPIDIVISDKSFFDIGLLYDDEIAHCIKFKLEYRIALYDKKLINSIIGSFKALLSDFINRRDIAIGNYSFLNYEQYDKTIYNWNATDKEYTADIAIAQLFEAQVEVHPETTAVVYDGVRLSYGELNRRSNQLARVIRAEHEHRTNRPLAPDTLIGLYTDKSLETVVGIMAILKAGGAYMPIDTGYPRERVDSLLEDSGAVLVLSQRRLPAAGGVGLPEDKLIYIDLTEQFYDELESSNLPQFSKSTDLAYVIYTSGTTWRPKGVMIEQRGVVNLALGSREKFEINTLSKILQYASTVFDASVWEIFIALLSGGELFIAPAEVRQDAELLREYLAINKITLALLPPVILELMHVEPGELGDLRTLLVGGDVCPLAVMTRWGKGRRMINAYGPTEITVCATMNEFEPGDLNTNIGVPQANVRTYVLDEARVPVPIGVAGELYIGGAGLARGYLNQAGLTDELFIANLFATKADLAKGYNRLYKTGDIVRWLDNGALEFVGRNDSQVKIRGYRIELGEIEHALSQVRGIKQSCVLVKERKTEAGVDKYLVGYYVPDTDWQAGNDTEILEGWEDLFDTEYEKATGAATIESDFTGWNSYITSEAIPVAEMQLWRDEIVDKIRMLKPSHVMEIGVGSGLLMYPLLNEVQRYVGLDISQSVIRRHRAALKDKEFDTSLYHLRADQVDQLPGHEKYDTIIINSVCQYFPGIDYFEQVLEQAIAKLSPGGAIFVGDVRNYDSHKQLVRARFEHSGQEYSPRDVDNAALKENELLISPKYFSRLSKRNERIEAKVLRRSGKYDNELSQYRYDVLIRVRQVGVAGNKVFLIDEGTAPDARKESDNDHNVPYLNQLSKEEIIRQLEALLPTYMIPAALVAMESFPITANGKIIRDLLSL